MAEGERVTRERVGRKGQGDESEDREGENCREVSAGQDKQ